MRGFDFLLNENGEKVYPEARFPEYATIRAAGADFYCAEDIVIPTVWELKHKGKLIVPTLVHTGVKVCMEDDEQLELYNRSGNPKRGLVLANGVGVVDADYWDANGEVMFAFYNISHSEVTIKAGDRIGQGVFTKFLRPDFNLKIKDSMRTGGFGSTGG